MEQINFKEKDILKKIIDIYIETGQPVGSQFLGEKFKMDCSSATIRNVMHNLEKKGYLQKNHTSSGRIPSIQGLEYYAKYLAYNPQKYLEDKLQDILAKRRLNIDTTIEQAAHVISEVAGLTLITTSNNSTEVLKSIQLTVLNNYSAIIVLITSTGRVESKVFNFDNNKIDIEDVRIAVKLFKDRLVDTPLIELSSRAYALIPMFSAKVKNYELIIQEFIKNIFVFKEESVSKIYNKNQIILSHDISREKIVEILDFVEHHSVWEALENELDEDSSIRFDIKQPNISLISKKIEFENEKNIKEVTIIGSSRMDYSKAFDTLDTVEKLLKKDL
ncbi:heat-inducible transcriptional repressor HrcA [Mycoplasma miroungirhinis]|uniref:Heat-inducible transcription repressor HrcA n=1 Tax=Mycoplasma miroungirhinis TaxID=754516 RepID=A0A6M4JC42_9MOLU|nr:heat-inducible transcriptional repressor HrcA [Mycoplasma miroungirhinis]QJR43915.1 heat-inducible transcriptional repressor HrcA [Mycoplasma miroungirhinis]